MYIIIYLPKYSVFACFVLSYEHKLCKHPQQYYSPTILWNNNVYFIIYIYIYYVEYHYVPTQVQ